MIVLVSAGVIEEHRVLLALVRERDLAAITCLAEYISRGSNELVAFLTSHRPQTVPQ